MENFGVLNPLHEFSNNPANEAKRVLNPFSQCDQTGRNFAIGWKYLYPTHHLNMNYIL
jgi:hypothetical protein